MKRLLLTIALLPALALAQVKPLPWAADPISMSTLPFRKMDTADGYAVLWAYKRGEQLYRYEAHCIKEVCTPAYLVKAASDFARDPAGAFWARAKTSTCFDPNGYWPTQAERNLCAAVRAEYLTWAAAGFK